MILEAAAIAFLISQPACGGVKPDSELAIKMMATAAVESRGNTLIIGINGVPKNQREKKFNTPEEATAFVRELDAKGIDYDAGLFQINKKYSFAKYRLNGVTAFNACENARAAAEHLRDDFKTVSNLASRIYNCGGIDCGKDYATYVDAAAMRIREAAHATAVVKPRRPPVRVLAFSSPQRD